MRSLSTTRHRAQSENRPFAIESLRTYYSKTDPSYSSPTTIQSQDTTMSFPTRETDDVVTEDYQTKIRNGEIVMNDFYNLKDVFFFANPSSVRYVIPSSGTYWSDVVEEATPEYLFGASCLYSGWTSQSTDSEVDAAANLLIARLYNEIKAPSSQLIVTVAELKKSVRSLNRAFRLAWSLFKDAKSVKQKLLREGLTAAEGAALWLEIRYGLRPIVYDVIGIVESIEKILEPGRTRIQVSSDLGGSTNSSSSYRSTSAVKYNYDIVDSFQKRMTAGAIVEFNPHPGWKTIKELGLTDIAGSVWELVPFSFIVDWFLNIGNYIRTWEPMVNQKVTGTWLTVEEHCNREIVVTSMQPIISAATAQMDPESVSPRVATSSRRRHRYANPSKPWLPSLNLRLDGLKIADLLALMQNLQPWKWRI